MSDVAELVESPDDIPDFHLRQNGQNLSMDERTLALEIWSWFDDIGRTRLLSLGPDRLGLVLSAVDEALRLELGLAK